jgi:hypothetical protein
MIHYHGEVMIGHTSLLRELQLLSAAFSLIEII